MLLVWVLRLLIYKSLPELLTLKRVAHSCRVTDGSSVWSTILMILVVLLLTLRSELLVRDLLVLRPLLGIAWAKMLSKPRINTVDLTVRDFVRSILSHLSQSPRVSLIVYVTLGVGRYLANGLDRLVVGIFWVDHSIITVAIGEVLLAIVLLSFVE